MYFCNNDILFLWYMYKKEKFFKIGGFDIFVLELKFDIEEVVDYCLD